MIRILTAYHFQPKPGEAVENDVYRPLVLPVRDPLATHDPIMEENSFAEMRAHHWAQLNWESGVTHYGFQHYRRWFLLEPFGLGRTRFALNVVSRTTFDSILATLRPMPRERQEALSAWAQPLEIVAAMPVNLYSDLAAQFVEVHGIEPWRALLAALDEIKWDGPRNARVFYPGNMFIIRPEPFALYMTFWREVMRLLSPVLKPERGTYQERIFGFLSERLWTLWLLRNRRTGAFGVTHVPVLHCAEWTG
ncbi:MAG TPA: DUF4422 domain-containing protein [Stellaceae bacterium]|nr:DUF4422 domain-containing protein [Stellaceae bacterium]